MAQPIRFDEQGNLILHINWKATLKVAVIVGLAIAAGSLPIDGLTDASRICLMIFVGAAGLWVTEAIPPFATAIAVVVLCIYLLGSPAAGAGASSYKIFLNPMADPVLVLFFGGFVLAVAASKHGFDVRIAKAFLQPFGKRPPMVLLGVISITALFSMFMSNTATTAMMIAIIAPLVRELDDRAPFRKALVLAIPFAANIGGVGTIIGTPPNAVAASVLTQQGTPISFFAWMLVGVPVAIVMLVVLWLLLLKFFSPKSEELTFHFGGELQPTWDLIIVTITFGLTVSLWLTGPLHHIPSAVVALIPVMIFTMFGIIDREDLRKIEWHVLILVAGGMTLGVAMSSTGLSDLLVGQLTFFNVSPQILLVVIVIGAVLVSNFMSNTSAANLLIPIVTAIAGMSPLAGAVAVALACSMAMSLPISTPPNAIAFATQEITTRDMARYGTIVSVFALVLLIGLIFLVL